MAKPIGITGDWTASGLRRLAASSTHANQSRPLLSLAVRRPAVADVTLISYCLCEALETDPVVCSWFH